MKLLINGMDLDVNNAYAERDRASGIITLFITVPYAEMGYESLKSLFIGNTEDIVKTSDDGSVEIFSGFAKPKISDDDEAETYTVTMVAEEYDFQLGRNRALESKNILLENTLASKDDQIAELEKAIREGATGGISADDIVNAVMEGVDAV